MNDIKRILLPTDFSTGSDHALELALLLAEGFRAEVHMFHAVVLNGDDPHDPAHHFPEPEEIHRILSELAHEEMAKRSKARPASEDVVIRAEQRRAISAAPAILEYAAEEGIDLIVQSTHGRHGPARLLLGSVAQEVVRRARCPVLTTRLSKESQTHPKLKRILAPVDFAESSRGALSTAADLARIWDSEIDLLHVVEDLNYPTFYDLSLTADLMRQVRERAEEALDSLASDVFDAGLKVEKHVVAANRAAPLIVHWAAEHEADLIVLPRHGRTALEHFLFGSTAERVVQASSVPVLVMKGTDSAGA